MLKPRPLLNDQDRVVAPIEAGPLPQPVVAEGIGTAVRGRHV
jgi:hypothetical protein